MKLPSKPYVPSWRMTPGYLERKFWLIRKQQQEQRKKAENAQQQVTRPEQW